MKKHAGMIGKWSVVTLLWMATLMAQAQSVSYKGMFRGSSMKVDGTSTVHDWTIESKLISGSLELTGDFPADLSVSEVPALSGTPKADVKISARSLKSGKPKMDQVMLGAMKADDHPWITYSLKSLTPSKAARQSGDALAYDSVGELSVSGVKKEIKMPVTFTPTDKGLKINGKVQIKMTDYGIDPPAPKIALGLITVGDELDLTFEWHTQKK
jgi:polyisoprenoid-binding protein YceI